MQSLLTGHNGGSQKGVLTSFGRTSATISIRHDERDREGIALITIVDRRLPSTVLHLTHLAGNRRLG